MPLNKPVVGKWITFHRKWSIFRPWVSILFFEFCHFKRAVGKNSGVENVQHGSDMKMGFNKKFLHTFRGGKFDVWNQIFSCFPRNLKKRQFCFAYFSVKTAPTEVMEYSRTEPAEKPSKQSPQIFYFWCFITEIFRCKVPKIWKKNIVNTFHKVIHFQIMR